MTRVTWLGAVKVEVEVEGRRPRSWGSRCWTGLQLARWMSSRPWRVPWPWVSRLGDICQARFNRGDHTLGTMGLARRGTTGHGMVRAL